MSAFLMQIFAIICSIFAHTRLYDVTDSINMNSKSCVRIEPKHYTLYIPAD